MVLSVQSISEIPTSTLNHLANQNNDAGKSTEISEPSTERIKIQPPSSFCTLKSCHLRVLCSLSKLSETEMSRFRQLVTDKTVDIYFKGDTSFSPLELLIRCNQSDSLLPCLKLLLEREDATCDKNALMLLLRRNSSGVVIECAKLLIERGVKVQHTDAVGRNALLLASEFYRGGKMLELLEFLLQHGADVLQENKHRENALFLLHRHYRRGNLIDLIRLLILRGVKVNCCNSKNQTALHILCMFQQDSRNFLPILKLLVEHGIDASAVDGNLESALTLSCRLYRQSNLLAVIRFLVSDCGVSVNSTSGNLKQNALLIACQYQSLKNNFVDIIRFFIERGINLSETDSEGRNLLHILCKMCKGEKLANILRVLTEETQLDVNGLDNMAMTPLDIFRQKKYISAGYISEITQFLTR